MNEAGEIVGMVDVLKLTYATLEQASLSNVERRKSDRIGGLLTIC
jgi:hypothetical protein